MEQHFNIMALRLFIPENVREIISLKKTLMEYSHLKEDTEFIFAPSDIISKVKKIYIYLV